MTLIESLRFVQGAVAKKDFAPTLTHFRIQNRTVRGFNGTLAICSPIDCDLDISPKAVDFVRSLNACVGDTVTLQASDNGRLIVQGPGFRSFINCDTTGAFPDIRPEGRTIKLTESLLPALRYLEPFIATDASRPWACGALFANESAFATNNIAILEYWLGFEFPGRVNIPAAVVRELLRIGEDPISIQLNDHRMVFHFDGGRWLSTQLLSADWPNVGALFEKSGKLLVEELPPGFFPAVEKLLPFVDDLARCYFFTDRIASTKDADVAGTSISLPGIKPPGVFNARTLWELREIAKTVGFAAYPEPVPFYGERSRGIIAGIRA